LKKICLRPFESFQIYEDGRVFVCCPIWLEEPIGNLFESEIEDIFNSKVAVALRESIINGSFKYCEKEICPYIQSNQLPGLKEVFQASNSAFNYLDYLHRKTKIYPLDINLSYDKSCNLQCPSCRTTKIFHGDGPNYEKALVLQNKVIKYLDKNKELPINLSITGSGDPFGSKIFRTFLFELDGGKYPNLKINLITNGVLFTRLMWDKIHKIHNNLANIFISFDASCEETYLKVRKGGIWKTLLENTQNLSKMKDQGLFDRLRIDFVVQKQNFKEMVDFVRIGKDLGVNEVYFSLISDWNTWPSSEFLEQAVHMEKHPLNKQFREILQNEIFRDPIVNLGNLYRYRRPLIPMNDRA